MGKKAFPGGVAGSRSYPSSVGYLLFIGLNYGSSEAMFVGAAMVATSVGITARVIKDLHLMNSVEARIIIGAAVIDDVMGLIVLSIVIALWRMVTPSTTLTQRSPSWSPSVRGGDDVTWQLHKQDQEERQVLSSGRKGEPQISTKRKRKKSVDGEGTVCSPNSPEERARSHTGLYLALILCLFLSAISTFLGLAAIVGAFLAGMLFAEFQDRWLCKEKIESINEFIVPFFFVFVGMQVDIGSFSAVIGIALILTIVAVATKFVGCGVGALSLGRTSAAIVGSGMFPRGEVAMIVATIGLAAGIVEDSVLRDGGVHGDSHHIDRPAVADLFLQQEVWEIG